MAKITSIASKYVNRLTITRDRVSPKHQPISVQETTLRIYAEADQICFGEHHRAAVTFDDSSILLITAGQPHALRGRAKQRLIAQIEALPADMRHHPGYISGSGSYRMLYEACLAVIKPTPPPHKPKATLCFNPIPPP